MSTFVMVHGAWHGAWCWDRVVPHLSRLGHDCVAVDLPCEDPEAGLAEYASSTVQACAHIDGPVIVVGHSLGTLTIPLIPALREVTQLVFLSGVVPEPGLSYREQSSTADFHVVGTPTPVFSPDQSYSHWTDRDAATRALYHDCAMTDAHWAFSKLRIQRSLPALQPCPLDRWPTVRSSYILATDDRLLAAPWARRDVKERLKVDAVELPGDHSSFLSHPTDVALALHDLASDP